MYIKDVLKVALLNALRGRTRSVLTALSIMIGVSSVLLVSSIGTSGEALITREIEKMGLQGISVYQTKEDNSVPLHADDAKKLENRFKTIEQTLPIVFETGTYKMNNLTSNAAILGVGEKADKVYNVSVLYGRIPNESDVKKKARVVVIDDELAYKTYRRSNVVGKELVLKINNVNEKMRIIGVIKSQKDGINQMLGNNLPDIVYMPYSTLNELRESDRLNQITVKCVNEYTSDGSEFAEYLSNIKSSPGGYTTENLSQRVNEIKSITGLVSLLISAIAGIALCVAGLGVMNTMFSSTAERKREIGVCMAIGARSTDILMCFLMESIIIALIGGTLGAIIGCAITMVISNILNLGFIFNIKSFVTAEIVSFICGGLFSAIPALKASKLQPIDALRQN